MSQYKRILLKLSGELLAGNGKPFDPEAMAAVAKSIKGAVDEGVQVAIVVGGGNLLRGRDHEGDRSQAELDHVGMLATVMNVGLLRFHLEDAGLSCMGVFLNTFEEKDLSQETNASILRETLNGIPVFDQDLELCADACMDL